MDPDNNNPLNPNPPVSDASGGVVPPVDSPPSSVLTPTDPNPFATPAPVDNTVPFPLPDLFVPPAGQPVSDTGSFDLPGVPSEPASSDMPGLANPADNPVISGPDSRGNGWVPLGTDQAGVNTPESPQPEPVPTFTADASSSQGGTQSLGLGGAVEGGMDQEHPSLSGPVDQTDPSSDAAPTDLSHLMDPPGGAETAMPSVQAQPESLVVPPPADTSQVVTSGGAQGFPKWVFIAIGAVLLLGVAGASAYFILGIGKPAETSTSISAEEQQLVNPPKRLLPPEEAVPIVSSAQESGGLMGASPTAVPNISPTGSGTSSGKTGTSAIDLIRQRQSGN